MKPTRPRHGYWGIALLGLVPAQAGVFFVQPAPEHPSYHIAYSASDLHVADNTLTATTVEDVVFPTNAVTCAGYVSLPAGVQVQELRLTMGGVSSNATPTVFADDSELTRLIRESRRPTLASHLGSTLVRLPGTHWSGRVSVSVTWTRSLEPRDGVLQIAAPMPVASLAAAPVRRAVIDVSLRHTTPLRALFSPTHECQVTRSSARDAHVRMSQDQVTGDAAFALMAVADDDPMGLRLFAHRPESAEDGYFVLVGCASDRENQPAPREWVFVVDTSGSMRGDKMEQARAALEYCLGQLPPQDRFNLVGFSDTVKPLFDTPRPVTPEHLTEARRFVDALEPDGRTNIGDALAFAVTAPPRNSDAPAPARLVVFLTDGAPTVGERQPELILSRIEEVNTSGARIFSMGIGFDVNAFLLDRLARDTRGDSDYVDPEQDLDDTVAALYNRIAHPVMQGVTLDVGGLDVYDLTPVPLPDLYRDSLLLVAGRYRQGGTATVHVVEAATGHRFGRRLSLPNESLEHGFTAPLWAARRLGDHLEDLRLNGGNDAALTAVVGLSRRYGILTEYTAAIQQEASAELSDQELAQRVKEESARARAVQSGQWAVTQSLNDKGLKERVAVSPGANSYLDAQGEVQEADNIRQVGKTAFYKRNEVWVAAEDGRERRQREVRKFSEEYFELLRTNREFSEAAALGDEVILNLCDEQIHVK